MAVLKNRAKMSTSTTGTGTITLGSAESGYQTFADAGVANADVVRYVIEDTGGAFEIGTGTYTSSGTTLSRTVSESSNSNNAINLSGSATVFIGATAADIELSGNMAGDISSNGHAIKLGDRTGSGANELIMGAGDDFKLYHNGSTGHSIISETGSGNLQIAATNIELKAASGHALLTATYGGSVDLYHNSSKKAETTSSGLQTTGTLNVNGAYTLPTADGSNGYVLTTNGSGVASWAAGGGGGADLYAANESSPSAQPSATGANAVAIGDSAISSGEDAISLGVSRATGNHSFAAAIAGNASHIGARGNYSIAMGYEADTGSSSQGAVAIGFEASAGANYALALGRASATGADSVALGIANGASSYGASGANSISLGKNAKSTANYATAIGESTQALGNNSVCLGYYSQSQGQGTMVMGYDAQSTAVHCTSIGTNTRNAVDGTFKFSGGMHSASGDAQVGIYPVLCETTDATATTFVTYHSNTITPQTDNQIVLPNNSAYAFSGTIVARQKASEGTACAAWEVKGLIRREGSAGTTVLVNSATTVLDNTPNWGLALSADTANGCLKIQGTGASSTNIRWSSTITTSELTYA